eukprot:scaffold7233_cov570-Prasinococcus_capsulatus_cf.AAC.14
MQCITCRASATSSRAQPGQLEGWGAGRSRKGGKTGGGRAKTAALQSNGARARVWLALLGTQRGPLGRPGAHICGHSRARGATHRLGLRAGAGDGVASPAGGANQLVVRSPSDRRPKKEWFRSEDAWARVPPHLSGSGRARAAPRPVVLITDDLWVERYGRSIMDHDSLAMSQPERTLTVGS